VTTAGVSATVGAALARPVNVGAGVVAGAVGRLGSVGSAMDSKGGGVGRRLTGGPTVKVGTGCRVGSSVGRGVVVTGVGSGGGVAADGSGGGCAVGEGATTRQCGARAVGGHAGRPPAVKTTANPST
jgi:hypothetical protein